MSKRVFVKSILALLLDCVHRAEGECVADCFCRCAAVPSLLPTAAVVAVWVAGRNLLVGQTLGTCHMFNPIRPCQPFTLTLEPEQQQGRATGFYRLATYRGTVLPTAADVEQETDKGMKMDGWVGGSVSGLLRLLGSIGAREFVSILLSHQADRHFCTSAHPISPTDPNWKQLNPQPSTIPNVTPVQI